MSEIEDLEDKLFFYINEGTEEELCEFIQNQRREHCKLLIKALKENAKKVNELIDTLDMLEKLEEVQTKKKSINE